MSRSQGRFCGDVQTIAAPDERSVEVEGRVVGALEWGEVGAFDPSDASLLWKTRLDFHVGAVARGPGGTVVVAGGAARQTKAALAAVDGHSGAVRWRAVLPAPEGGPGPRAEVASVVVDGDRGWTVVGEGGLRPTACRLVSFETSSGEILFSRRLAMSGELAVCSLALDGNDLLVGRAGQGFTLVDACTGEILAERRPGNVGDWLFAFREGRIFLLVAMGEEAQRRYGNDPSPTQLLAIDVRSGAELWRHPDPLAGAEPLIVGPWVVVQTYGGELQALDRATGDLVWSYYVGDVFRLFLEPAGTPRWLIVDGDDQRLTAFDLRDPRLLARPGATTIRGRLRPASLRWRSPPRWVLVGNEPVPVRRGGEFEATVEGAGVVRVRAVAHEVEPARSVRDGCPYPTVEQVALDGGRHEVTLEVGFGGCE